MDNRLEFPVVELEQLISGFARRFIILAIIGRKYQFRLEQ
jgi:hypothetical protein